MKEKTKIIVALLIAAALILLFALTGCVGPLYTKEGQHSRSAGWGLFGSGSATQAKVDRLALAKLGSTPAQTQVTNGAFQGYRGLVANLSRYQRYNFKIVLGPETKSYLLGPGERVTDYLLPGEYTCVVFRGSSRIGQWTFRVGVQQSIFMNETYHWYVYADR